MYSTQTNYDRFLIIYVNLKNIDMDGKYYWNEETISTLVEEFKEELEVGCTSDLIENTLQWIQDNVLFVEDDSEYVEMTSDLVEKLLKKHQEVTVVNK